MAASLKPLTTATARNAILINQLATPGLGSLMARRYVAGSGQLLLAITGFIFVMLWFVAVMRQFYGQIEGNVEVQPVGWLGWSGLTVFGAAWLWALITSISLWREARRQRDAALAPPPPPPLR